MIFFKPKKLVVDLFTTSSNAYEYAKPTLTKKWYPQWWKQLPKEFPVNDALYHDSTMKRCFGMTELYQYGFIVPLWADLAIEVAPIGVPGAYRWNAATNLEMGPHAQEQRGGYLPDSHYQHLKIKNVWRAKTKEAIPFLLFQPTWNYLKPEDVIVPPGILPLHNLGSLNVNMFIPKTDQSKKVMLELGQPLVQLVPFDMRPLEVRTHLVDDKELRKQAPMPPDSFNNVFPKMKRTKEGCPLHEGA